MRIIVFFLCGPNEWGSVAWIKMIVYISAMIKKVFAYFFMPAFDGPNERAEDSF